MPETFTPTTWVDGSGGGTPITAAQLNRVEQGVESMDDRVTALEDTRAQAATIRETWTGVNGAAWPAAWTGANGTRDIQSNAGRHITAATASAVTTDAQSGPAAGELVVRFQWSAINVERYEYFACRAADFNNNTHVRVTDTGVAQTISIRKRVASASTLLSTDAAVTVAANTWYWVRFRWAGSDYKARFWPDGDPEPVTWNVTATDTAHTSGSVMLATQNGADALARTTLFDDLQVWEGAGVQSVAGKTGAVTLVPGDVGLGAVANAAQVQLATIDAKGDLLAGTAADTIARVAVGANGRVVAAASAQATGVEWQANPTPATVALTDGATVALDAAAGKVFKLTAAGDRTISVPTNPLDGRGIIIAHTASVAARTLALTTGSAGSFIFGSDITALSQTALGKTDYIGAVYDSTADRWRVVSYVKGF